jgi:hypothetical protein
MKVFFFLLLVFSSFSFGQVLQASYKPLEPNVALELALLEATNAARAENGLGPLQMDETLALAARHHALEMATSPPHQKTRLLLSVSPGLAHLILPSVKTSPRCRLRKQANLPAKLLRAG